MEDLLTVGVVLALLYLSYLGWKKDKRWARILVITGCVVIAIAVALLFLFVSAMGQANWSL